MKNQKFITTPINSQTSTTFLVLKNAVNLEKSFSVRNIDMHEFGALESISFITKFHSIKDGLLQGGYSERT